MNNGTSSRVNRYEGTKTVGTRTNRNKNLYDDLNNFERYTNFTDVSKIEAVPLETLRENANKREGYRYLKDYDLVEKKKERKESTKQNGMLGRIANASPTRRMERSRKAR